MEKDLKHLSKSSTSTEIKQYFNAILTLSKASEEFPVNLDEVWPLVYGKKSDAVEALQRDFMESVDYQVLRQNPQNLKGGRPAAEYHLSVPCLEFFIARKVRPVFEVYRQVFHKTAKQIEKLQAQQKPMSPAELILQMAQLGVEHEKRIANVENKVEEIIEAGKQAEFDLDYLPVADTPMPGMSLRKKILAIANTYQKATQISHQALWKDIYKKLYYIYGVALTRCRKINKSETWLDVAERKGHLEKIYTIVSEYTKSK